MLKKKIFLEEVILQNFIFSSRFMLFPTFKKKKIGVKKKIRGGGGGSLGLHPFFHPRGWLGQC